MPGKQAHNSSAIDGRQMNLEQLRIELAASRCLVCAEKEANGALLRDNESLRNELTHQATQFANMQYRAYFDHLTGLPNRSLLIDRVQLALANAARSNRQVGLLFMDLNGFKRVNDEYGHAVGDKILQRVAKRITCSLRAIDTACRYGGDEFVVLLPEVDGRQGATRVAGKIDKNVSMPYHIAQQVHNIGVSIGVAVYPSDGAHFAALMKKADVAMYVAKTAGVVDPIEVVAVHAR